MDTFLFDFDGTLVDSMPVYTRSMLKILDDEGITYDGELVKTITPLGLLGTAEYYVKIGVKKTKEQIVSLMGKYMFEEYLYNIPAKDDVVSVLREFKSRGASLNVLTASPHITLDPCLKRIGIYDLFDNVWSCDDFATTKSDPKIYLAAAEKLSKNVGDILFLDDNLNADLTAKSAGMKVCGVYDASSKEYTEEIKVVTDYYIEGFSQLLDLF